MDCLQYVRTDSFLHRLDPRTKFLFFVVMALLTSFMKTGAALTFLFVVFLVVWYSCGIGKYFWALANKLKVLLLFIGLLWLVLGAFEVNQDFGWPTLAAAQFSLFGKQTLLSLDLYDLYKCYVLVVRVLLMVASFYTVILTTNFSEIILGLQKWHIPYSVSFGIGLVFQIIPIIIQEFYAIMDAQRSRGLEIEKCSAAAKLRNYVTISLPLLFRVLAKGHAISLAMHYYKLDFKVRRTAYKDIAISWRDTLFNITTLVSAAAALALRFLVYYPVH